MTGKRSENSRAVRSGFDKELSRCQSATGIKRRVAGQPEDEPVARRMYDAIAPVVDRIQKNTAPTQVPQAVVDDAAVPAAPPRASATTGSSPSR